MGFGEDGKRRERWSFVEENVRVERVKESGVRILRTFSENENVRE